MGCAASAPYSSTASSPGGVGKSIHTFMQGLRPWDDGNDIVDTTMTNEPIEEIYYYNQRRLACPAAAAVAVCCVRRGKKDRQSYHIGMINQRQSIMKVYDDSRTLSSSCDRTAVIANVDWKTPGNDDDGAPDGSPTRGRRPSPSSSSVQTEVIRVEPTKAWDDESPLTRNNNFHHRQQTTYPSNYLLRTPGTSVSVTPNSQEKEVYIAERRQRMELLRKSLTSLNEVHISDSGGGAEGPYLGSTYWVPEYNTNNNSSSSNSSHEMMYMTPIESVSPQMEYITPIDDCSATRKKTQTSLSTKDHLARLGLALFNNDFDEDDEMYNKTPNSSCSTSASENTPIDNFDIYEDEDHDDGYLLPPQHDHAAAAAAASLLDISSDLLDYSNMTELNNNGYDLVSHHQHHAAASLLDISSDLLDLSLVNTTGEQSYTMPRRLFDDDHSNDDGCNHHEYKNAISNSVPKLPPSPKDTPPMRRQRLHSGGGANKPSSTTSNVGIPSSLSSLRNSPYVSPLNGTPGGGFDDDDHDTTKHMMEQRISTLPSLEHAKPIRLCIEEKSSKIIAVVSNSSSTTPRTPATPEDEYYFSYDPHFPLMSEYNISNYYDGRPYGNGLVIKMGGYDGRRRRRKNVNNTPHSSLSSPQSGGFASASQFMILEDRIGNVPCVIKSLRTHIPSMILYSPKARYVGQKPSAHRLVSRHKEDEGMSSNTATTTTIIDDNGERDDNSVALYPWAFIGKSGRTREDDCIINLVKINDSAMRDNTAGRSSPPLTSNGIFHLDPSFRGRHGFDERGLHTHTVVHRITSPMKSTKKITNTLLSNSETNVILDGGVPCCLMIRDPSNVDTTDLTIAPGIDPLLMICYLTCHTKMDVECIITGF